MFRVVQIINVDCLKPEISTAALDLILEKPAAEAVAASNHIDRIHDAAQVILFLEKAAVFVFGCGRISIERDVTTL